MIPCVTGTCLMVQDFVLEQDYIMGPFEDDEFESNGRELLKQLRPEDNILAGLEIESLNNSNPELLEYKEALLLAISPDGKVCMAIWDMDHRE